MDKENKKTSESNSEDFAKLLDDDNIKVPQQGDIISGKVLSASKSEVRLDIDGIIIGIVRGQELYNESEEYADLKPGDEIEATVMEEENENGELELSFRHAGQQKAWSALIDSYENKKDIKVKVVDANKGGLVVSYAQIQGFLPVSQLAPENYPRISGGDRGKILEKLRSFIGKELKARVITLEEQDDKVVVSERKAWQEKQKDVISKYKAGSKIEGTISAMTSFGVFVNFDKNLEGLVHISELAWQRIDNPANLFKIGDKIKAEIISIDGSKIFLSAKRLIDDPWKNVAKKYKEGQTVDGEILKVNPFGLFVKLDAEIHGLSHISQLNLAPGQKIYDVFKQGEKHKFIIASIDPENHRLGLVRPDGKKDKTADDKPQIAENKKEKSKKDSKGKGEKKKEVKKEENKKIKKNDDKKVKEKKEIKSDSDKKDISKKNKDSEDKKS